MPGRWERCRLLLRRFYAGADPCDGAGSLGAGQKEAVPLFGAESGDEVDCADRLGYDCTCGTGICGTRAMIDLGGRTLAVGSGREQRGDVDVSLVPEREEGRGRRDKRRREREEGARGEEKYEEEKP